MTDRRIVAQLKAQYPVGTRVRLLEMEDGQAPPIGTIGTVRHVDDEGTIFVSWDGGHGGLGVVYGVDWIEKA